MNRVVRWLLEHLLTPSWPQAGPVVPAATPDFKAEPGTIVVQGSRRNGRLVFK